MSEEIKGGKTEVELEVRDKNGKVVQTYKQEAKSWLANYYAWLEMLMHLGIEVSVKNESGVSKTIRAGYDTNVWDARDGAKTALPIGSSDTAWNVDQYNLQGYIAAPQVTSSSHDKTAKKVVMTAVYTTTPEITIKETGVMVLWILDNTGSQDSFYIERSVLGTPVTVPAGGSVTVKYTITHA